MRHLPLLLMITLLSFVPVYAQDNAPTIAELVETRPELTAFSAAIQSADPIVLETLSNPDANLTLFAPTDAAFRILAEELAQPNAVEQVMLGKDDLVAAFKDQALMTDLVLYHVIDGAMNWDDFLALLDRTRGSIFKAALNGDFSYISANYDNNGKIVIRDGIQINYADIDLKVKAIEASNGVIYLINQILLPEIHTIADKITEAASNKEHPEFTVLKKILETADPAIWELLGKRNANITLFAPTDAAFTAMSEAQLTSLTGDKEQATKFLNSYIVPDLIYGFQIRAKLNGDGILEIKMAEASIATIRVPKERRNREFYLNDILVAYPDTAAQNGMIQIIDDLTPQPQ